MAGVLYVVATPIGNLGDITLRALETLRTVDLIAAEDTRHTKKLLQHYGIETPLISFHQHSGAGRVEQIIRRLQQGESVALVTDAGTPGISDPGGVLVEAAHRAGVRVVPVPGVSAVTTILSVAGLPAHRFRFEGFPPRKEGARRRFFEALQGEDAPIVLYESPHRLLKTLQSAYETLGDCTVVVGRELTKQFEEVFRGRLSEAIAHWQVKPPKGEFVVVLYSSAGRTL
ncbi:MAG: 16S rRNA (cytidine(1402)-2'-O)-methyltransferase [Fimbriimonadales bacterium]|nr:16S rRNA (cytidine(1402)-2'-O)-methyltransferase [Fimbriimonadales bacterium]